LRCGSEQQRIASEKVRTQGKNSYESVNDGCFHPVFMGPKHCVLYPVPVGLPSIVRRILHDAMIGSCAAYHMQGTGMWPTGSQAGRNIRADILSVSLFGAKHQ
jgi:hypothetical protein